MKNQINKFIVRAKQSGVENQSWRNFSTSSKNKPCHCESLLLCHCEPAGAAISSDCFGVPRNDRAITSNDKKIILFDLVENHSL